MFYEAQIAGLPDTSPAVRLVKRRSAAELADRRGAVVDAVRRSPAALSTAAAPAVCTSDPDRRHRGHRRLRPLRPDPLRQVRRLPAGARGRLRPRWCAKPSPARGRSSAAATSPPDRPAVTTTDALWPRGADCWAQKVPEKCRLRSVERPPTCIWRQVWMRYAKAGEMLERFDRARDRRRRATDVMPTYRGEGKNFG